MSIQHKTVVVSIPNFPHPFGAWSKTMGILAVTSLSLYSFPSLNDMPSREIEFFTSLNTVGPQERQKRSRILKHVPSPGYKIKTSFLKGCSQPSETGSRDGAYEKAVCVLCGGLCSSWQVTLKIASLGRFVSLIRATAGGEKSLIWKVCG